MKIDAFISAGHGQMVGQDRILAVGTVLSAGRWSMELESVPDGCYGIFDGVGGLEGGAEAATFAATQLIAPPPTNANGLQELLIAISEALMKASGATTATGLRQQAGSTLLFHTGNTRLWGFDGKYLVQLTNDQTLVEEATQALSDQERASMSHIITGCLGGKSATAAHRVMVEDITRNLKRYPLLMFTCDGVHETLSVAAMESMLREGKSAMDIVLRAVADGSQDDCSVMLMRLA